MLKAVLTSLFFIPLLLTAQSYDAGLGLRLGTDWGATAQIRLPMIHKNFVLEGILQSSLQKEQGSLTVLGKQHRPLLSRRLNLFYGAGAHLGWSDELDPETAAPVGGPVGIDGVIGLEATFGGINLAYDFKPAINIGGGSSFLETQTAVSVRYVIAKRHTIWDKKKERQSRKEKKQRQRKKQRERRQEDRLSADKKWYEVWKKER